MPAPDIRPATTPEDAARIASLEAQLAALAARKDGLDPAELQGLLDAQSQTLRADFERQLQAQQAAFDRRLASGGPVVAAGVDPGALADREAGNASRKRSRFSTARSCPTAW